MLKACGTMLLLLVCSSLVAAITVEELPAAIEAITSQPQFDRMEWGILAEVANTDGSYTPIYAQNARQLFTPASNNKVLTTAPAFLFLGDSFRISTPLVANTKANNASACLLGRGDPSVELSQLDDLAASLATAGISHVGQLTFDDSYFPSFPPAWEWEDLGATYGAQPNSLILTQNAVTLTVQPGPTPGSPVTVKFSDAADDHCMQLVNNGQTISQSGPMSQALTVFYNVGDARIHIEGQLQQGHAPESFSLAVLQPAERFRCVMEYSLRQVGVTVGSSHVGKCQAGSENWAALGAMESQYALVDTMNYTLQESDNLFAECFQRTLGALYPQQATGNAQQKGMQAIRTILSEKGVDVSSFKQDDGSGLSRHNLVSPQSMAETLVVMANSPNGATYRSFLPVAGESGTLSSRFIGTPAQGNVQAKTGTVSGVSSLSGYINERSEYPQIVFSIITNFSSQSASVARSGIDDIVVLMTQLVHN